MYFSIQMLISISSLQCNIEPNNALDSIKHLTVDASVNYYIIENHQSIQWVLIVLIKHIEELICGSFITSPRNVAKPTLHDPIKLAPL